MAGIPNTMIYGKAILMIKVIIQPSIQKGEGVKEIKDIVYKACQGKIRRDRRKGIKTDLSGHDRNSQCGKIHFINSFVGRATAKPVTSQVN